MPKSIPNADTLTNFTTDPARFLDRLRESGEPMLLTVEGEGRLVVQDATSYQRFLEAIDRLEALAGVKQGLADVAAGRTRPVREFLEEQARKHKLASTPSE